MIAVWSASTWTTEQNIHNFVDAAALQIKSGKKMKRQMVWLSLKKTPNPAPGKSI